MLKGLNEELALPILQQRRLPDIPEKLVSVVGGVPIMVTGAGGSVGSEIVLQLAVQQRAYQAKTGDQGCLVLLDSSEINLYEINQTLAECAPDLIVHSYICDVRDPDAVRQIFREHQPKVVFHTAALKHVPLLENGHNLVEAVLTNVYGTTVVQSIAKRYGCAMVLVSTDKAVNPSSVMGLTKRAAEKAFSLESCEEAHMSIVRFGNVLGSSGSVVPLFRRQIAQGGPVTVTHKDMTRYMMTIRQAAELVVMAASTQSHRKSDTQVGLYVLDMGEPVKIMELAEQMIRHSGLRPGKDIEIQVVGIRPGEKLHEELFYSSEEKRATKVGDAHHVQVPYGSPETGQIVADLIRSAKCRDVPAVKKHLLDLVPEYTGAEKWK